MNSARTDAHDLDVSVIIPAWKAAALIGRSVASALASTGVRLEVIIVDDASPDETFKTAQALAMVEPRVIVDRLDVNAGPSSARNRAISLARGRYVAVLDADDTISPDRLKSLVALGDRTGADIIVDNMVEVDEAGQNLSEGPFLKSEAFAKAREISLETWVAFNQPMKPGDCLGYLKPLFRLATLQRTGERYDAALRNSEDYYIVAHLLASGARMTYTPEAGYAYTRSTGSTSHRLSPAQTQAWRLAEDGFRSRHRSTLTPAQTRLLDARARTLRETNHFVGTIDALNKRSPSAVFRSMASDLSAAPCTALTLAKIALGRVVGRKLV